MDAREKFYDFQQALVLAMQGQQAKLWTSMPGIIESFNSGALTAVVQVAIQSTVTDNSGNQSQINIPLIPDVPVVFPSGGGYTLTFPVAAGDECVIWFSARCIDAWWQSGGIQSPADPRMHDLSDAFCMVGPKSQPKVVSVSNSYAELKSNDGTISVRLDKAGGLVDVIAPNGINLTAPVINLSGIINIMGAGGTGNEAVVNGSIRATGNITAGYGGSDQVDLQGHSHGGGPAPTPGT